MAELPTIRRLATHGAALDRGNGRGVRTPVRCGRARRTVTSWFAALALLVAQSQLPGFVAFAQGAQGPVGPDLAQLERLFDALEAAANDNPRDTFDAQAVLMQTDLTPEGVFAWVRDNTYLVSYQGALRGPVGVLMDRVGNSLDRALLLQELLQQLGYETRLARAELAPERASALLSAARRMPPGDAPQPGVSDVADDLERFAAGFGLDVDPLRGLLDRATRQHEEAREELARRVERQAAGLLGLLEATRADPRAGGSKAIGAARDHWWVQVQREGSWTDLDPSLPDAKAGDVQAEADETLVSNGFEGLPPASIHTLALRVVLECVANGALEEVVLVEAPALLPAHLLGQRIAIQYMPSGRPQGFPDDSATAFEESVLRQDRWFPVIRVGSNTHVDREFSAGCDVGAASPSWLGEGSPDIFGQAGSILGGIDETGPEEAPDAITALWIEYSLQTPGEVDRVIRRQVFDVLGPSMRAEQARHALTTPLPGTWRLALAGETEILPLFSRLSLPYVEQLTIERWLAQERNLLALLRDPSAPSEDLPPVPSDLYALALARSSWSPYRSTTHLAELNILSRHVQAGIDASGAPALYVGFDIVTNRVAAHPDAADAYAAVLGQGVVDTTAETLLGLWACREADVNVACRDAGSVSEIVDATSFPEQWTAARTLADVDAWTSTWPEDARERVRQQVSTGHVVVLPTQPVITDGVARVAWWRVDGNTGETLGFGENGWGQAMAERAALGIMVYTVCQGVAIYASGKLSNGQMIKCALVGLGGAIATPAITVGVILTAAIAGATSGY